MSSHGWAQGEWCRVVEHDEETRQPKPGGKVIVAKIRGVASYIHVDLPDGRQDHFHVETGWRAWNDFRWRLLPGTDTAPVAGKENR